MADGVARVRTTYLVKQAELAIRKDMDRILRRLGLTTPQYTALSVLQRHPGMSSAQLARRSFVSPQAANEMVAALEAKGLVRREVGAANRRVLRMELTEEGRTALGDADREVDRLETKLLHGLPADQRRQLRSALENCVRALSDDR